MVCFVNKSNFINKDCIRVNKLSKSINKDSKSINKVKTHRR